MTKEVYNEYVTRKMPKTKLGRNTLFAFVIGGLICLLGELIGVGFMALGMAEKTAAAWTSISLIFLGSLFTALGLYDNLAKHAGAGTLVPITGFANAIVSPAMEFKSEGHILGLGAKMFIIAGPVIVFGVISSIAAGILSLVF